MEDSYRYILRYYLDPGWEEEARTAELLEFCRRARVAEVMLFFNAEELFTGHVTPDELAPWLGLAGRLKARLAAAGIAMSLNPWTTTAHLARGRKPAPGREFRLLVGETGVAAGITACPLDARWRDYLGGLWAWLARELEPAAIWIEDDFRLHNHDPEQGWGGCFCDEHLRRFAALAGRAAVSREEVLQHLLAPGKPHPWRRLWMRLWRDTMTETMAELRRRVPCRLGLMSSAPDVHSIEGRDWPALCRAMTGGAGAVLSRPHLPPYSEIRLLDQQPVVTRQTVARLPRPAEIYPELESGLRCGWYSRSPAVSVLQCFQAALIGSRGITINHFDMMGCGLAMDDPGLAEALAAAGPRLDALAAERLDDDGAIGVTVLSHPEAAAHLELETPGSGLAALTAGSGGWSHVFFTLGIAHRLSDRADAAHRAYALSGQAVRAFSDAELDVLLGRTLLVDAVALQALADRVPPAQLGLAARQWRGLEQDAYAYEEIVEADPAVYGIAHPRTSAQMCADRVLRCELLPGARVLSRFRDARHRELYCAFYEFATPQGGRLIAAAYPLFGGVHFNPAFYNRFRRIFLQRLLRGEGAQLFGTNLPLQVYGVETDGGLVAAAFNVNTSVIPAIGLELSGFPFRRVERLGRDGVWRPASADLAFTEPFAPLEGVILKIT